MQVSIGYKKPRHYPLHGSTKKLGKSIVRGNKKIILKRVTHDKDGKKNAAVLLGKYISEELKCICSDNLNSILRENSKASMEYFSWQSIWLELEKHAVLLTTLLKHALKLSNTNKKDNVLSMLISMMLKSRNPKVDQIQSMVSLILYAGHAGKQVYSCVLNI